MFVEVGSLRATNPTGEESWVHGEEPILGLAGDEQGEWTWTVDAAVHSGAPVLYVMRLS
jgi:hypothetical protein